MRSFLHKQNLSNPARGRIGNLLWGTLFAFAMLATTALHAGTAMSGTYTVCTSGCDFSTPQAAADSLVANGVSGPVTVKIDTGSFAGPLRITGTISGASATNTITFQGKGAMAASGITRIYTSQDSTLVLNSTANLIFNKAMIYQFTLGGNKKAPMVSRGLMLFRASLTISVCLCRF